MSEVPVVIVKTANGPVRVNKSDYDADPKAWGSLDKDATADEPRPVQANVTVPDASPQYIVLKEGRKFFVSDMRGVKAGDIEGYKTEAEACKARDALKA